MDKKIKKASGLHVCECQHCGRIFAGRVSQQKYYTKKCRIEGRKERLAKNRQPCEHCQRATGIPIDSIICPWARAFHPVPGWEATPHIVKEKDEEDIRSYRIYSCPLFIQDPPRKGRL